MKPQPKTAQDARAFEEIMRKHNRMLFRTARAILRDDAEAEDALQEAYVQAYNSMQTFRAESKLSTWLARIVANEALMRLRKETRRAEIVPIQSTATVQDIEQITDSDMNKAPDAAAERRQMRRVLESQIDALPDTYRTVFMLRAVEELSVEETAAVLDLPAATVRTRFFRARSMLREMLAQKIDVACEDAFSFAGARCDRIVANVLARIRNSNEPQEKS
ncbi:MAG TPA: RNA polymerase sigma factor [Burkholderiales bacterium]|jgi:RNA polymerase sigma-70 factor (ECF subfamily)|nr:RNA polymerase sigma factor [Burkholderiales bacterium]